MLGSREQLCINQEVMRQESNHVKVSELQHTCFKITFEFHVPHLYKCAGPAYFIVYTSLLKPVVLET